jgi:hypothetical protein
MTGTGGSYSFSNRAAGTYDLAITRPSNATCDGTVSGNTNVKPATVTAGQTTTVNFACTSQPTGDFTVILTEPIPAWSHDMPGISSLECKIIRTSPAQAGATFSVTTTGPTEGGPSGVVTVQPVTGTLNANGAAELRVRINQLGTYVNNVSVTSGTVTRSANVSVTVTAAPNTCPALTGSSRRFKRDIVALLPEGDTWLGLRPVAFRYVEPYGDPTVSQIGLIAEDVVQAFPQAVALDRRGRPYAIAYDVLTGLVIAKIEERVGQAMAAGIVRLAEVAP